MFDKIKVLIVGYGSIGRRHFNNLIKLGYSNISFVRTMKDSITDDELKKYSVFNNLDDALQQKPQIVFVTNPTSKHMETAIKSAESGCHLFIEKPLSHTVDGYKELSELVTRKGLITMIGCQFRFHPLLNSLQKSIQAGKLGNIVSARAEYGEYLPSWHPWENHRKSYSARNDLGGGVILTLIHPLDYLYWLFGSVRKVHASFSQIDHLNTNVGDDLAEIILNFNSGIIGQIHLDYIQKPPVHQLCVLGDAGRANLDFIKGHLEWINHDGFAEYEQVPGTFDRNTMFTDELKHFMNAVENNKQTDISLSEGIDVLELALKAKQYAQIRQQ